MDVRSCVNHFTPVSSISSSQQPSDKDFYLHFKVGETEAEGDKCAPSLYMLLMLTPDLFSGTFMFLTIRNAVTPGQEVPGR